jgi:NAD(P)-dependent dehydrogenase (short-subunit alcohol dehydrogenase family)
MDRPSIDLSDRVALVTGGGAGIGRGVAIELARCGADVAIADIDARGSDMTSARVTSLGRRALRVDCDVMDSEQVRSAVATVADEFGRVDILVNNAGGVRRSAFLSQSERSWRRHIELNLTSVLTATAASVPLMISGGRGGSVVNVATIEASRAAPGYAVYAACKAAVVSFTRSIAVELAEHAIRVNAISPDLTRTPGTLGFSGTKVSDELPEPSEAELLWAQRYIPIGRQGTIEDCGRVVAFLCSPLAGYVTGVNVPVDGGTWASSGWSRSSGGGWTLAGE